MQAIEYTYDTDLAYLKGNLAAPCQLSWQGVLVPKLQQKHPI
jgi:hypothetical protein